MHSNFEPSPSLPVARTPAPTATGVDRTPGGTVGRGTLLGRELWAVSPDTGMGGAARRARHDAAGADRRPLSAPVERFVVVPRRPEGPSRRSRLSGVRVKITAIRTRIG